MQPTEPTNNPEPSVQPTADAPQQPQPTLKSKKKLFIGGLIVLALIVVGLAIALMRHHSSSTASTQNSNGLSSSANPAHINGIAVNTFPYLSACQVYDDASSNFAGIAGDSLVIATYAEGGIAAKDIPSNGANGAIDSHCTFTFGADTAYAGTTVVFYLEQFPTEAAAKTYFSGSTPSDSERDAASKAIGANLPSLGYAPLAGAPNTVYSDSQLSSNTLYKNIIISFGATSLNGTVNQDMFKQSIIKALPTVMNDIDLKGKKSLQQLQAPPAKGFFGQKIGDSTHMDPCSFFTADDYAKGTGSKPNPAEVDIQYNIHVGTYYLLNQSGGLAVNSCTRNPYPKSAKNPVTAKAELHYFKTSGDAAAYMATETQVRKELQYDPQTVNGVGDRAFYAKPVSSDNTLSYYYVQKGAYVLVLQDNIIDTTSASAVSGSGTTLPDGTKTQDKKAVTNSKKYPTADDYKKLAQLLVPKLK